jgi:predicted DNA-binding antitoxin AbrB/MazE fold protein
MTIKTIYQRGILKLAKPLKLKDRQPVLVDVRPLREDISSKSFRFLTSPGEDIYTLKDGKPVQ